MFHRFYIVYALFCFVGFAVISACAPAAPAPVNLNPTVAVSQVPASPTVVPSDTPVPTVSPSKTLAPTVAPAASDTPAPTEAAATATLEPTATVPASPTPKPAVISRFYFGASHLGEITRDENVRALAKQAGVQMVRTTVYWNQIQPAPDQFDWTSTDAVLNALTASNLVPLGMILENPGWASNSHCGPVRDPLVLDQFLRKLAARYPQVKYWALYNEPDNAHYPEHVAGGCFAGNDVDGNGTPDYQDYAVALKIARNAIHEANPSAQLVLGAVAYDNFDEASAPPGYPGGGRNGSFHYQFLPNLFKYMQENPLDAGAKYFDVFSFNFYSIYGPYWEQQAGGISVGAKTNQLRKLMQSAGISVPMLVSETGSNSQSLGSDGQSQYLARTMVRGIANRLLAVVWWTFQDYPDSGAPPTNTWKYGLIDQNASPKPSYAAYQTAARTLTGAQYLQALTVQGAEGYLFNKDNAGIAVVWSTSDATVTMAFSGQALALTDMYGVERRVLDNSPEDSDPAADRIGIQVDKYPLYVQAVNP